MIDKRSEIMLKKYATIAAYLFCLVILSAALTSCEKKSNGELEILSESSVTPVVTDMAEVDQSKEQIPLDDLDKAAESEIKEALMNKKELSIYCMDDDGNGIESVSAIVDENTEIDAVVVTEAVVNEFSNHNLDIQIDKVTTDENGSVFVSFQKDAPPVKDVEEDVECFILDCISQSILDNVETSKAVIFQIEGNAYVTEHVEFKESQAYDWR